MKILPLGYNATKLMETHIQAKDWVPFDESKLNLLEDCPAPVFKNQIENYRLRLAPAVEKEQPKEAEDRSKRVPPKKKSTSQSSTSGINAAVSKERDFL